MEQRPNNKVIMTLICLILMVGMSQMKYIKTYMEVRKYGVPIPSDTT